MDNEFISWLKANILNLLILILLLVLTVSVLTPAPQSAEPADNPLEEACFGRWTVLQGSASEVRRLLKKNMTLYPGGTTDLEECPKCSITWVIEDDLVTFTHHWPEGGKSVIAFRLDTSQEYYTLTALCDPSVIYTKLPN